MKKRDILLAGGIVLVALVMLLVMHVTGETKGDQVQITVNGKSMEPIRWRKTRRLKLPKENFTT